MRFAVNPAGPGKVIEEFPARCPGKTQNTFGGKGLSLLAGVGFNTPAQVFASPWSQSMAACRIPDKSKRSQQEMTFVLSIDGSGAGWFALGSQREEASSPSFGEEL